MCTKPTCGNNGGNDSACTFDLRLKVCLCLLNIHLEVIWLLFQCQKVQIVNRITEFH